MLALLRAPGPVVVFTSGANAADDILSLRLLAANYTLILTRLVRKRRHASTQNGHGRGSTQMESHFGVGAPSILEPILVGIGMFTGGNRGSLNPCLLIWGCLSLVLGISHFWRGLHPHMSKQGFITPGSTLCRVQRDTTRKKDRLEGFAVSRHSHVTNWTSLPPWRILRYHRFRTMLLRYHRFGAILPKLAGAIRECGNEPEEMGFS